MGESFMSINPLKEKEPETKSGSFEMLTPRGDFYAEIIKQYETEGTLPPVFKFYTQIETRFDFRLGLDPSLETTVKKAFESFIEDLKDVRSEKGEEAMLNEILNKFYKEIKYRLEQNSLTRLFVEKNARGNCDGRAKGIACCLEGMGYNLKTDVEYEYFKNHVRVVVMVDGKKKIMEGRTLLDYESTPGTVLETVVDSQKRLLGIKNEDNKSAESTADYYEDLKSSRLIKLAREVLQGFDNLVESKIGNRTMATAIGGVPTLDQRQTLGFLRSFMASHAPSARQSVATLASLALFSGVGYVFHEEYQESQNNLETAQEADVVNAINFVQAAEKRVRRDAYMLISAHEEEQREALAKAGIHTVDIINPEQAEKVDERTKKLFGLVDVIDYCYPLEHQLEYSYNKEAVFQEGELIVNVDAKPGDTPVEELSLAGARYFFDHEIPYLAERDSSFLQIRVVNFVGENLQIGGQVALSVINLAERAGVEVQLNGDETILEKSAQKYREEIVERIASGEKGAARIDKLDDLILARMAGDAQYHLTVGEFESPEMLTELFKGSKIERLVILKPELITPDIARELCALSKKGKIKLLYFLKDNFNEQPFNDEIADILYAEGKFESIGFSDASYRAKPLTLETENFIIKIMEKVTAEEMRVVFIATPALIDAFLKSDVKSLMSCMSGDELMKYLEKLKKRSDLEVKLYPDSVDPYFTINKKDD